MPDKEKNHKIYIQIEMDERRSQEVADKNYGDGVSGDHAKKQGCVCGLSLGYNDLADLEKEAQILGEQKFVDVIATMRETAKFTATHAFEEGSLKVEVTLPAHQRVEKEPKYQAPAGPPAASTPPQTQGTPPANNAPQATQTPPTATSKPQTVKDYLLSLNFAESTQKKPKHIRNKYFRSTVDDDNENTGYVNVEQNVDGNWKMSRWIRATQETIPYDPGWPEEYVRIMTTIDEITNMKKLGF